MPLRILPVLFALLLASGAAAAPLSHATLTIRTGSSAPVIFTATNPVGAATSPTSVSLQPGNAFAGTVTIPLMGTSFLTAARISIGANGAGAFSGNPLQGTAGFLGSLAPQAYGFTYLALPFEIGRATVLTGTTTLPTGGTPVAWSAVGKTWTTGRLLGVLGIGSAAQVASTTGTNQLSANGAGHLALVTPLVIRTDASFGAVAFARLELTFVPEPQTLALLLWGAGCLAWAGRRAHRR